MILSFINIRKVMSDQLERIEFSSTVLIIRHLEKKVQVDGQRPLSSSRIMKNSGREFRQVQFRLLQDCPSSYCSFIARGTNDELQNKVNM